MTSKKSTFCNTWKRHHWISKLLRKGWHIFPANFLLIFDFWFFWFHWTITSKYAFHLNCEVNIMWSCFGSFQSIEKWTDLVQKIKTIQKIYYSYQKIEISRIFLYSMDRSGPLDKKYIFLIATQKQRSLIFLNTVKTL